MENGVKCEAMCSALKRFKLVVLLASGRNTRGSAGKCSNATKCLYLEVRRGIKGGWSLLEALACAETPLRAFVIRSRATDFSGEGKALR